MWGGVGRQRHTENYADARHTEWTIAGIKTCTRGGGGGGVYLSRKLTHLN